jgi:hypothetical protein
MDEGNIREQRQFVHIPWKFEKRSRMNALTTAQRHLRGRCFE